MQRLGLAAGGERRRRDDLGESEKDRLLLQERINQQAGQHAASLSSAAGTADMQQRNLNQRQKNQFMQDLITAEQQKKEKVLDRTARRGDIHAGRAPQREPELPFAKKYIQRYRAIEARESTNEIGEVRTPEETNARVLAILRNDPEFGPHIQELERMRMQQSAGAARPPQPAPSISPAMQRRNRAWESPPPDTGGIFSGPTNVNRGLREPTTYEQIRNWVDRIGR